MSTDPRVETLRELRQINATLTAITGTLLDMADRFSGHAPAPTVNDSVCNGPHGDPVIKARSPRDWTGDDQTGRKMSECPPAYLDLLADRYDYFAGKDDSTDEKRRYAKLDASRARAWAARLRSGWTAPTPDRVDEANGEPAW